MRACTRVCVCVCVCVCVRACRVLQPGAVFLEISLADPTQRLALLCRPELKWDVSVCLLPRADLQHMVKQPGR